MTFHCHRLSCKMSEQACVHNQQIAREAQRGRPGGYPDHYYDRALSCFDCEQGKEIAGQYPAINQLDSTRHKSRGGPNMAFDFFVERNATYMELIVRTRSVNVSSGLLDEKESIDLAKELIYAAEQLLPAETGDIERRLYEAREDL